MILVVIALLAGLVAVVTSVLGIPISIRRQAQEPAEPAAPPTAARETPGTPGAARASARLFLALVAISVTGAVLATLALRWLGTLLERLGR